MKNCMAMEQLRQRQWHFTFAACKATGAVRWSSRKDSQRTRWLHHITLNRYIVNDVVKQLINSNRKLKKIGMNGHWNNTCTLRITSLWQTDGWMDGWNGEGAFSRYVWGIMSGLRYSTYVDSSVLYLGRRC